MDFTFTSEQEELRRAVRDLAADRSSSAHVRAVIDGATGHDPELWHLVGELGLPAVAVPEEHGGTGGTFVDAVVVLEEAGRSLMPVPLLPTIVAAAAGDADLGAAVAGGAVAALAVGDPQGEIRHVLDGALAEWFVIAAPDRLWLASRADASSVQPVAGLDPVRRQATLRVDPQGLRAIGDATASARAVDLLRVALSVEALGVARWCLAATVEHLKTRVQFDRPIGSFQALQHRAADLAVLLESAAATAYYAGWVAARALAEGSSEELPVIAPLSLAVCGEAAYRIAADTIQLHGGIGFTWEHDAHLYFKRATANRLVLGDTHEQRRLVAQRAGLAEK